MGLIKGRKVPLWTLILAVAFLALACLVAAVIFKEVHSEGVPKTMSEIGIELFKTVFIGGCVGLGIELYMKYIEGDSSREMFEKSGIANIYSSRESVIEEFKKHVENRNIQHIHIVGISLRGFLSEEGKMRPVWDSILDRLSKEEEEKLDESERLHVRLLLLDPRSSEGHFRYKVEKPQEIGRYSDIEQGINEIQRVQEQIYKGKPNAFFQARYYDHCPFSFLFVTEASVFLEQYYYRDFNRKAALPMIEFRNNSPQYGELQGSVGVIWKHAHTRPIEVGTAISIDRSNLKNIFREDNRLQQTKRQIECIRNTNTGTVDILAISGAHYIKEMLDDLRQTSLKKNGEGNVTVRFALVNPVSQQAIFRAVADGHTTEEIRGVLENYSWESHSQSKLYKDVDYAIQNILYWKDKGHSFDLHLYSCSVSCGLLLTQEAAFVGQYIYGRSKKLQQDNVLRSEYPLIEYQILESGNKAQIEQEILDCTFKIIWDYYSVPYDSFKNCKKEEEFNKNLIRLREELGCVAERELKPLQA